MYLPRAALYNEFETAESLFQTLPIFFIICIVVVIFKGISHGSHKLLTDISGGIVTTYTLKYKDDSG